MTSSDQESRELVVRCIREDSSAWSELVECFTPGLEGALRGALRRFGRERDDALIRDALQETFVYLLRDRAAALRRFRWSCPLEQYFAVVARSRCLDLLRRQPGGLSLETGEGLGRLQADLPGDSESRLRAQIARLSAREQLVLGLFYWDGLSLERIGKLLRMEPNAAGVLLFRARAHLREFMEENV